MVRGFIGVSACAGCCVADADPLEVCSETTVARAQAEYDGLVVSLQLPDGILACLVAVVVAAPPGLVPSLQESFHLGVGDWVDGLQ